MRLLPALEEAWGAVIATLDGLTPADWETPTPCDLWTVHDVAAHLGHLEGMSHGLPQPEPPGGLDDVRHAGLDLLTNRGVAARAAWSHADVLDEICRASALTLERLWGTDDEGWKAPSPSPIGMVPLAQAMELRLADVYVHLLDIRHGLGRALTPLDEPLAAAAVVARAIRLTPWAAVKRAALPDGTRIRLELEGPSGRDTLDLFVDGGRGHLLDPEGTVAERIEGTGLAYLLAVSGRSGMVAPAGGLGVTGNGARALIASYRLFG